MSYKISDTPENRQESDADFYRLTKFDAILIALILFLSVASLAWINHSHAQGAAEPKMAMIYQGNKLLERVALDNDRIFSLLGGRMQVEVKGGKERVLSADCPQHVCVTSGWIQYHGQTIVCVPNKVLIEIKSKGSALLDAVAI